MENQKDINETNSSRGAPEGNNNAGKGSQLSALLRAALNANDRLKMRQGVEAVADAFAEGERWAVEFVFDRFEGKAVAKTEISGTDGTPLPLSIGISFVEPTSTISEET
jgi:hypothetical protein